MKRKDQFQSKASHPFLSAQFKRLKPSDLSLCKAFLDKNADLNRGDFELAVNRWFMDQPEKPKNWKIMTELMSSSNAPEN